MISRQVSLSHLHGVSWREEQFGMEVEEGWLGEAALVQAALVCAEHCEAQQVCITETTLASLPKSLSSSLQCSLCLGGFLQKNDASPESGLCMGVKSSKLQIDIRQKDVILAGRWDV